jgi:DNA mismatch repair protein MutL
MGKITVLPDVLCNQIAAGEVIERPAAVVKELIENSMDAGARRISVILSQGGRKEIRVIDNGTGMNPDDALLALERHATSKIRSVEDLQSIRSMGFRGEALPSIAAVSRFDLITREPDAVSGVRIHVEGGVIKDVKETGCPAGTMVCVRDLFHNMPARRKFLRSIDTEMAHIGEQFIRISMSDPGIHFQLSHEERQQYDFAQTKTIESRAGQVLGSAISSRLKSFTNDGSSVRIHGLAGPPDLQKASGHFLYVYVNGRAVWDRMLHHAILNAYEATIPKGRFPVVVLFIELPPHLVDVNVHPTKREVRFQSPGEMMEMIRAAVRLALENPAFQARPVGQWHHTSSPDAFLRGGGQFSRETQGPLQVALDTSTNVRTLEPPVQVEAFPDPAAPSRPEDAGSPESGIPSEAEVSFSRLRIIGQLANTYLLLEGTDGLVLVDQHAAHERIIYDRLSQETAKGTARQRLARSAVLNLSPEEGGMLRRWMSHLADLGFEIEAFGGDSFTVQSVPAALSDYAPEVLIGELLSSAHEEEKSPRLDLLAQLAKTAACHEAIRAGQKLDVDEMRNLLEMLDRTRIPPTCPHGRPLWHRITLSEIARFFQRT